MPKFIVTHGSTNLGPRAIHQAGAVFEATEADVEGVPNILPFVEGEPTLATFIEQGLKPSGFHKHLLALRAKKAAAKAEAHKAESSKGK